MQIVYFIFDDLQQLRRVPQEAACAVWQGRRIESVLPFGIGREIKMISVLMDENLAPRFCYFLRLDVAAGQVTGESRLDAMEAMTERSRRRYDHPSAQRQFAGWPRDWRSQLAVAVDAPVMDLKRIGIGGPLLMADQWGVSIERILEYFDELLD